MMTGLKYVVCIEFSRIQIWFSAMIMKLLVEEH